MLALSQLSYNTETKSRSGTEGNRTPDLRIANAALSQLSYDPVFTNSKKLPMGAVLPRCSSYPGQCPPA